MAIWFFVIRKIYGLLNSSTVNRAVSVTKVCGALARLKAPFTHADTSTRQIACVVTTPPPSNACDDSRQDYLKRPLSGIRNSQQPR